MLEGGTEDGRVADGSSSNVSALKGTEDRSSGGEDDGAEGGAEAWAAGDGETDEGIGAGAEEDGAEDDGADGGAVSCSSTDDEGTGSEAGGRAAEEDVTAVGGSAGDEADVCPPPAAT